MNKVAAAKAAGNVVHSTKLTLNPANLGQMSVNIAEIVNRHELTKVHLSFALEQMAGLTPAQFAALTSGDYDGTTGDVLLQLMAFGCLKYA